MSRLLYGCCAWSDVTPKQLQTIESHLLKMQRSILNDGFWSHRCSTDEALRQRHNLKPFRAIWMKLRISYLQHAATTAPAYYRQLLIEEYKLGRGWLFEVQADLKWAHSIAPLGFDLPEVEQWDWPAVLASVAAHPNWKCTIGRVMHLHLLQESLATKTMQLHQQAYQVMGDNGTKWMAPTADHPEDATPYSCEHCDKSFAALQALTVHMYHQHGITSPERGCIHSTRCPGCLRDFWTTRRLQQHLHQRKNRCFDRVEGQREAIEPEEAPIPRHLRDAKNLPVSLPAVGPLRPLPEHRNRPSNYPVLASHTTCAQHRCSGTNGNHCSCSRSGSSATCHTP